MNKDIIQGIVKGVLVLIIVAGLMAGAGFGGYKWKAADYAKTINALNKKIYDQGVEIQNAENNTGELNRELKIANKGRIDAITNNDHNTERVKKLQAELDKSRTDISRLIVFDVNAVKRVYDQSRNECNGLPGSNDPALVPARVSEFTGDSVTGVVRDLVGRYCSIATDYNGLYKSCETLLAGKKNPGS